MSGTKNNSRNVCPECGRKGMNWPSPKRYCELMISSGGKSTDRVCKYCNYREERGRGYVAPEK